MEWSAPVSADLLGISVRIFLFLLFLKQSYVLPPRIAYLTSHALYSRLMRPCRFGPRRGMTLMGPSPR